jgi:hypothetical protein
MGVPGSNEYGRRNHIQTHPMSLVSWQIRLPYSRPHLLPPQASLVSGCPVTQFKRVQRPKSYSNTSDDIYFFTDHLPLVLSTRAHMTDQEPQSFEVHKGKRDSTCKMTRDRLAADKTTSPSPTPGPFQEKEA